MLGLNQLRNPARIPLAGFDLAEVDLACAVGLPGSERLNADSCLAWIDHAVSWTRRQTEATFGQFVDNPARYDGSESIFRIVSLMNVLWRGMGVQYNRDRIDDPEEFTDSRDDFIHGIIEGRGGTCASLPVLVIAVGRRLGYPLRLVKTARHQFCRWDDPFGERFNIEIGSGLNTYPDEHYLKWPVDIRGTSWQESFLRSLSPCAELAQSWSKRGHCLHANGRLGEAVDAFAVACSMVAKDRSLDDCLLTLMKQWRETVTCQIPGRIPKLRIYYPQRRRYAGLPLEMERDIIGMEVLEKLLDVPVPDVDLIEVSVSL